MRSWKNRITSRKNRASRISWIKLGLAVALVVAVALYVFWPRPEVQPVDAARLNDDPALGDPGAVITIEEFGDFGCSACWAWHHTGILEELQAEYGDQLRFVWRDFPVITPNSSMAAEAAQCAYDQGMFWEYHDYLYEEAGWLSNSELKEYASEIGLDIQKFNQCLDSRRHQATIEHDKQEAIQHGFRGTPAFLVNEQPLVGTPSYNTLKSVIEAELAQSEN